MYTSVIGIDVSKTTIDASIKRTEKKNAPYHAFLNKPFGFQQLLN